MKLKCLVLKRLFIISLVLMCQVMLYGCSEDVDKKTISIAVTGSPSVYSDYFEKGIKEAYEQVTKEYPDYNIVCEFYDDKDDYATAEQITSKLVNDESVTAIIASSSPEVCDNQVYQTGINNKLLICPHWIYDETLTMNSCSNVFALNYSNETVGGVMSGVADYTEAKNWALCYADDKISRAEIRGFGNKVNIVDSVKINELESGFDKTVNRWKLLGVDGVVYIPYDEDFDLFYKLKDAMPEISIIIDSTLDDSNETKNNKEYFNNVYLVNVYPFSFEESSGFFGEEEVDTIEIHAYNTLRMIVDTAVKNNTNDPVKIAEALHRDGYKGELENYSFNENGSVKGDMAIFNIFVENGYENGIVSLNKGDG